MSCEGFLWKRGDKGYLGHDNYKRRYFKVEGVGSDHPKLAYYKTQSLVRKLGEVDLATATQLKRTDAGFHRSKHVSDFKEFGFEVHSAASRVYYLVPETSAAATDWIASLSAVMGRDKVDKSAIDVVEKAVVQAASDAEEERLLGTSGSSLSSLSDDDGKKDTGSGSGAGVGAGAGSGRGGGDSSDDSSHQASRSASFKARRAKAAPARKTAGGGSTVAGSTSSSATSDARAELLAQRLREKEKELEAAKEVIRLGHQTVETLERSLSYVEDGGGGKTKKKGKKKGGGFGDGLDSPLLSGMGAMGVEDDEYAREARRLKEEEEKEGCQCCCFQ